MAKWNVTLSLAGAALSAAAAAAGCQQQPALVAKTLPPPNFDGPVAVDRRADDAAGVPVAQRKPVTAAPRTAPQPAAPAYAAAPAVPADWVPHAAPRRWKWIVIHHSATATGGATAFDRSHRAQGWDEMGYHFVIGNGSDTRDGQVQVGSRWPKQKHGAHAKTPDNRYNDYGIGICLVGDFEHSRPSAEQVRAVSNLVAHLMRTYDIDESHVIGHDGTGKSTRCPGRHLSLADVRRRCNQLLAQWDAAATPTRTAAAADNFAADAQ